MSMQKAPFSKLGALMRISFPGDISGDRKNAEFAENRCEMGSEVLVQGSGWSFSRLMPENALTGAIGQ
jgi:hypothetical protein